MARISKFELSLVASVAFGALIPAESGFAADTTSATANPQKVLVKKPKVQKQRQPDAPKILRHCVVVKRLLKLVDIPATLYFLR